MEFIGAGLPIAATVNMTTVMASIFAASRPLRGDAETRNEPLDRRIRTPIDAASSPLDIGVERCGDSVLSSRYEFPARRGGPPEGPPTPVGATAAGAIRP
jgi:hypothetical protein